MADSGCCWRPFPPFVLAFEALLLWVSAGEKVGSDYDGRVCGWDEGCSMSIVLCLAVVVPLGERSICDAFYLYSF